MAKMQRFKKGDKITFQFMFPDRVKRLIFSLVRSYEPNNKLLEQVIENPSMEKGVAEVVVTDTASTWLGEGTYDWNIFVLANDGTRDTMLPYSEGKIQIFDWVGVEKK
jgi:hypothetical protein